MAEGTRKNPLEYEREYNEFMYKLKRFLASKDMPMKKLPLFGGEEIDLYLLYKTVTDLGGWMKVTDEKKWHEVAKCFNLPASCLNSAFALRQLYVRYLEGYEKLHFLGEEGDDSSFPRLNLYNHSGYSAHTTPALKDPQKNFERLVLSLQSGLPNEVDFAFNICMLLSNVNNSVFNLAKAPAVVDMMLAHVGVFLEDSHGSRDLYEEWYRKSGKDFLKFWRRMLNCEEIKELLPKDGGKANSEEICAEELFNLGKPAARTDYELQRVLQVCTILHNFSFDKMDASVLSSHPVCLRFLLLCLHSNVGSLKKLATDTMSNLADKIILEPLESLNSQLFFFMVDRYVRDPDRYNRICAMNILRKVCLVEENQNSVRTALDATTYEALIKVLILEDVQLLVSSLETLYQLTTLGQIPCDQVVTVERSIEILVSVLSVCVEAFGAETLSQVKVIDNYQGIAACGLTTRQSPVKTVVNSTEQAQRSDAESEALVQHWLRASYDVDPASTIFQRDLYADYLTSCGKLTRCGILNTSSFYKILRLVFPDLQVVKLQTGNQPIYGLVGIRKKVMSEHAYGQATVNHSHRPPLCRTPTPPSHTTSSIANTESPPMGVETNHVKVAHAPRTPTPPIQREIQRRSEDLVTNTPAGLQLGVQSPSLVGQRHDVNTGVSSSPHTVQPGVAPTVVLTQTPNTLRPSVQMNSTQVPQVPDGRNNPVNKSQFPGTTTNVRPSFADTTNSGNVNFVNPAAQGTPLSTAILAQRNVSTVGITPAKENVSCAPNVASPLIGKKPGVAPGTMGTTNGAWNITASSASFKNASLPPSEYSVVSSVPSQFIISQSGIPVSSQGIQSTSKIVVMVNGGEDRSTLKAQSAVNSSGITPYLPAVNGNGDSKVLHVAKEERATKMARLGHEVLISVVENPNKPTVEAINHQSKPVSPSASGTSSVRKRTAALPSDRLTENAKVESTVNVNGPFVASEMLRNVAKRQRLHSDGGSVPLVNGVGSGGDEQKDPVICNELSRSHQKPNVTSPKMPIAVNGVRLDVISQHADAADSKIRTSSGNSHGKTNALFAVYNTQGNITNAVGNHSVPRPLVMSTSSTTNSGPGSVLPSTAVASRGQSSSTLAVVLNRNVVVTTTLTSAVIPGSSVPGDNSRSCEVRGEQASGICGPYRCMWSGCTSSFVNSKLLYNHAVSVHAPTDQLFTSCQWEGCSHVRRSRASLLFHLRQRHLNPVKTTATKDSNSVPKPQKSPAVGPIPPPQQAVPPVHGRHVYPPHPSVNPLLMSLKEQLLQTEQESPLTKSVRLTAALILRNIAKYSPSGRKRLKRYESSFTEIMCSKVESNVAIASCLHEMTRKRQENVGVSKR